MPAHTFPAYSCPWTLRVEDDTCMSRKFWALVSWHEADGNVPPRSVRKGVRVRRIEVEGPGRAALASPTAAEHANGEEDAFVKENAG